MKNISLKKNIIILGSLLFGIILIPSIIFVISNIFFYFGKYNVSQKINSTLGEIFPYNQNILLKQADYFYKKSEFQTSLLYYLGIDCKNDKICFLLGHNLGNTYYRFGEVQEEKDATINFWKKSLEAYSKALEIKNHSETQMNYDFVRKKLEELLEEQQQEQKQQEEQEETPPEEEEENTDEQEENSGENDNQEQENQENQENSQQNEEQQSQESGEQQESSGGRSENSQPQSGYQDSQNPQDGEDIPTSQNPNFGLGGNEEEGFTPLTPEEREMILDQLERLKQEELQNRELNKPGNSNNSFDQFGVERFFNNHSNQDW